MGYYTSYGIDVFVKDKDNKIHSVNEDTSKRLIGYLRLINECAKHAFNDNGEYIDALKWYDHEEHLKLFSSGYPEYVFLLKGAGEEPGDMWQKYFYNGRVQYIPVKLVFDEFDMRKLR